MRISDWSSDVGSSDLPGRGSWGWSVTLRSVAAASPCRDDLRTGPRSCRARRRAAEVPKGLTLSCENQQQDRPEDERDAEELQGGGAHLAPDTRGAAGEEQHNLTGGPPGRRQQPG